MHPFFGHSSVQNKAAHLSIATVYSLSSLSVFEAKGQDALTFLQGQLTNDIVAPGIGQSRLAGYCTAQGRLLATMVLGQVPNAEEVPTVRGIIRNDILAAVLKRLSMFVLRAKVTLRAEDIHVAGVCAPKRHHEALVAELGHPLPIAQWETLHTSTGTWIAAPSAMDPSLGDEALSRWWWIAGVEHQAALEHLRLAWTIGEASTWDCQDIQTGLPWIEARTQDLFIPQTLNLELIGGVSFTKGCYPGQEIVARSHYRGTVKKRMALGQLVPTTHPAPLPGSDIFDASQPGQPCGRLINVSTIEADGQSAHWVLFETSFESYDRQQLSAVDDKGPVIKTVSLPYTTR
ncbi:MAG: folate-binding protein [Burkholderiaceae bacterium]|nr:folate-binding protein [Burkholderiaceae bacterium]